MTGKGDKHPWLCSHLYAFLNSLKMQVPNGTGKDPAVKQVDYSQGGVYYFLPAELKAVIANKRALLGERYSASGLLNSDNSWSWTNLGNLWVPTEMEVCGAPVWGGNGCPNGGFVQYPIFAHNMNRIKGLGDGGGRTNWWELTPYSGNFFQLLRCEPQRLCEQHQCFRHVAVRTRLLPNLVNLLLISPRPLWARHQVNHE